MNDIAFVTGLELRAVGARLEKGMIDLDAARVRIDQILADAARLEGNDRVDLGIDPFRDEYEEGEAAAADDGPYGRIS